MTIDEQNELKKQILIHSGGAIFNAIYAPSRIYNNIVGETNDIINMMVEKLVDVEKERKIYKK